MVTEILPNNHFSLSTLSDQDGVTLDQLREVQVTNPCNPCGVVRGPIDTSRSEIDRGTNLGLLAGLFCAQAAPKEHAACASKRTEVKGPLLGIFFNEIHWNGTHFLIPFLIPFCWKSEFWERRLVVFGGSLWTFWVSGQRCPWQGTNLQPLSRYASLWIEAQQRRCSVVVISNLRAWQKCDRFEKTRWDGDGWY